MCLLQELMKCFGDTTTDGSIRLNSELYKDILSSDTLPNAAKLMDSALQCRWTKAWNYCWYYKSPYDELEAQKWDIPQHFSISVIEDRQTHKQPATEISSSKGLAKLLRGGICWYLCVPEFRHWQQRTHLTILQLTRWSVLEQDTGTSNCSWCCAIGLWVCEWLTL